MTGGFRPRASFVLVVLWVNDTQLEFLNDCLLFMALSGLPARPFKWRQIQKQLCNKKNKGTLFVLRTHWHLYIRELINRRVYWKHFYALETFKYLWSKKKRFYINEDNSEWKGFLGIKNKKGRSRQRKCFTGLLRRNVLLLISKDGEWCETWWSKTASKLNLLKSTVLNVCSKHENKYNWKKCFWTYVVYTDFCKLHFRCQTHSCYC